MRHPSPGSLQTQQGLSLPCRLGGTQQPRSSTSLPLSNGGCSCPPPDTSRSSLRGGSSVLISCRCSYDEASGQYKPVASGAHANSAPESTAGQGALAAAETALSAARQPPPASKSQAQGQGQRRKGAVIGSAPQYNAQGLLEMAAILSVSRAVVSIAAHVIQAMHKNLKGECWLCVSCTQEKEQQQKALAAQQAAQQKAKARQQKPAKPNMPGIGAKPSTGAAAAPAPSAGAGAQQQTVVSSGGVVQGVIHRGRWSGKV